MYSSLLAAILIVLCGHTLVLHSQPFSCKPCSPQEKRLAMRDQPHVSSTQDFIAFSISWNIKPWANEEWSGHARLQLVLHGFLVFWDHYFSDFSIGCNNGKIMTTTKTTVQLQFGGEPCILLQKTVQHIKLPHVWNSQYDCIKQSTCSSKHFEEIMFVVKVKSTKTAKFIVLEKFPLYDIYLRVAVITIMVSSIF